MSDAPLEQQFERYAGIHRLNAFLGIDIDMEAEISGTIRAIATSIDLVQKAAQIAGKTRNAELIETIADLRVELSQAKIAAANANEQIAELTVENRKLKDALATAKAYNEEKLVLGENRLYYTSEGDGPFCTACHDGNQKKIRVTRLSGHFRILGEYKCPICGSTFGKASD